MMLDRSTMIAHDRSNMKTERKSRKEAGKESFMSLLRRLRLERGLSQTKLAQRLKVDPSTVSFWESGTYMPSPEMIPTLARVLGITTRSLVQALAPTEQALNTN